MPIVASGQRDRVVVIQQLTDSVGASRFPVESWSDLTVVWARKEERGGRERFTEHQVLAPYDTTWTIPYFADMDPELVDVRKARRLVVKGRVHDIVAAQEVGRKRAIELQTLAGGLLT